MFRGNEFVGWIKKNFKTVNFEGFEYGYYSPTISIDLQEFEVAKKMIPTKNLIKVEGKFSVLQQLVFGVRDFTNEISF